MGCLGILVVVLLICSLVLKTAQPLTIDHVWLYQYSNLIKKGLLPYKDYNTFIPPFFIFIDYIFLSGFMSINGIRMAELIVAVIAIFLIFFIKIPHYPTFTKIATVLFIVQVAVLEYNFICFTIYIIAYLYLSERNDISSKGIFLLSILSFLCVCTKITYGIMMAVACLVCVLYGSNRLKNTAIYVISLILQGVILFVLMTKLGIWSDFADQCIYPLISHGLASQSNTTTTTNTLFMYAVFVVTANIILLPKIVKKYFKKELSYLIVFSYVMLGASYINVIPTFNIYHFKLVLLHLILFYIACIKTDEFYTYGKFLELEIVLIVNLLFVVTCIQLASSEVEKQVKSAEQTVIESASDNQEIMMLDGDIINTINRYIQSHGEKYLVISGYAEGINYFRNNSYNKYYDLMIDGNIGTQDPIKLINKAESRYDYIIAPVGEFGTYDRLLDSRIKNHLKEAKLIEKIKINDNIEYGVYSF